MFNYKKFSLPKIFTIFFSYSTNKTESPCANSTYSQCLNCFSYLLPAVYYMIGTHLPPPPLISMSFREISQEVFRFCGFQLQSLGSWRIWWNWTTFGASLEESPCHYASHAICKTYRSRFIN